MHLRPDPNARRLLPRQRSELVVLDLASGQTSVIYAAQELLEAPNWTLDGGWLVYGSMRDGVRQIYVRNLAGGKEKRLTDLRPGHAAMWPHWRP